MTRASFLPELPIAAHQPRGGGLSSLSVGRARMFHIQRRNSQQLRPFRFDFVGCCVMEQIATELNYSRIVAQHTSIVFETYFERSRKHSFNSALSPDRWSPHSLNHTDHSPVSVDRFYLRHRVREKRRRATEAGRQFSIPCRLWLRKFRRDFKATPARLVAMNRYGSLRRNPIENRGSELAAVSAFACDR